jgi:hypothetical protein
MYYIEIRQQIQRQHDPVLVTIDEIATISGRDYPFRSVYAYTEETAEHIYNKKSTAGLQSVYKYSDKLFIDIDGSDADVQRAGDKLCDLGIGFEYWTTGNRGGHFHVPIEVMAGFHVTEQQRAWVESTLPVKPDCSIYTCNGQWRMPGAIHSKTGQPKKLQETVGGTLLRINTTAIPIRRTQRWQHHVTIDNYVDNLTRYCGSGQRHQRIMMIVRDGIKLNFSLDRIASDMLLCNSMWFHPPMPDNEVLDHVTKVYQRNGG